MPARHIRHDLTLCAAPLINLPSCFEEPEANEFEELVVRLLRSGASVIVIDTREVEIVDSAGLLAVLDAGDLAYSAGAQLLVVPGPPLDNFFASGIEVPDSLTSLASDFIELAA